MFGVYCGDSLRDVFSNPGNMDLIHVVSPGGQIVWLLTFEGVAVFNPSNSTHHALLGRHVGNLTSGTTGLLTNDGGDFLVLKNQGGQVVYRVDCNGVAHTS